MKEMSMIILCHLIKKGRINSKQFLMAFIMVNKSLHFLHKEILMYQSHDLRSIPFWNRKVALDTKPKITIKSQESNHSKEAITHNNNNILNPETELRAVYSI